MFNDLLESVRACSLAYADRYGVARPPIAGLSTITTTTPSELQYAISKPLVALLLQGSKRVAFGDRSFDFGPGESLVITADVPTVSQITGANTKEPYFSLVMELDLAVIEKLAMEMNIVASTAPHVPVRVDHAEKEVVAAALRLMKLLDRPSSVPILRDQLVREMHYWLLVGKHGEAIRSLGFAETHSKRIARAIAMIRSDYARPLRVERLAESASMSVSSFHEHFRLVTSLTPLQFQKQLRLIEARRLMLAEGTMAKIAAYTVGYESVSQFTREYGRLFGVPPAREMKKIRLEACEA
ncbi:AraC family transcriptional regulator [Rhodanobacter glycinis]|uniref:AraC family transcriptional regulator n=1 Tax=Rhodanobacter glycinis TaxID=582702 RepID=A0A5B9E1U8_9GAMM|nr:AraC family transcriptional regulator [Rhodanobacter glycinis]QEE24945.1 AraC family transcriptional regulator [Rhodanobacter glycinis]